MLPRCIGDTLIVLFHPVVLLFSFNKSRRSYPSYTLGEFQYTCSGPSNALQRIFQWRRLFCYFRFHFLVLRNYNCFSPIKNLISGFSCIANYICGHSTRGLLVTIVPTGKISILLNFIDEERNLTRDVIMLTRPLPHTYEADGRDPRDRDRGRGQDPRGWGWGQDPATRPRPGLTRPRSNSWGGRGLKSRRICNRSLVKTRRHVQNIRNCVKN